MSKTPLPVLIGALRKECERAADNGDVEGTGLFGDAAERLEQFRQDVASVLPELLIDEGSAWFNQPGNTFREAVERLRAEVSA